MEEVTALVVEEGEEEEAEVKVMDCCGNGCCGDK